MEWKVPEGLIVPLAFGGAYVLSLWLIVILYRRFRTYLGDDVIELAVRVALGTLAVNEVKLEIRT